MGADPSPTTMTIPVAVLVVAPLTAEIMPANIKLARAPMNAFFTVQNLLQPTFLRVQLLSTNFDENSIPLHPNLGQPTSSRQRISYYIVNTIDQPTRSQRNRA